MVPVLLMVLVLVAAAAHCVSVNAQESDYSCRSQRPTPTRNSSGTDFNSGLMETNDHVPLAFLLGAKAKDYVFPSLQQHQSKRHPVSVTSVRAARRCSVSSTGLHPRRREEFARECLQQVLRVRNGDEDSVVCEEEDRAILQQILEGELGEGEDRKSRATPPKQTTPSCNEEVEELIYDRLHPTFLAVDGVGREPSHGQQQRREWRSVKQQDAARRSRIQHLRELLLEQQAQTKRKLKDQQQRQLEAITTPQRLSTSMIELPVPSQVTSSSRSAELLAMPVLSSAAQARDLLEIEQQQLRNRVQERRQLETLVRQSRSELHTQQKKALGSVLAPRPSFLATLQLENDAFAAENAASPLIGLDLGSNQRADERAHAEPLSAIAESLYQQQRDAFHKSDGLLSFGGGFMAKKRLENEPLRATVSELDETLVVARASSKTQSKSKKQ